MKLVVKFCFKFKFDFKLKLIFKLRFVEVGVGEDELFGGVVGVIKNKNRIFLVKERVFVSGD